MVLYDECIILTINVLSKILVDDILNFFKIIF